MYQHGYNKHGSKYNQGGGLWISYIRVQAQSCNCNDCKIQHISCNSKGPTGKAPVAYTGATKLLCITLLLMSDVVTKKTTKTEQARITTLNASLADLPAPAKQLP